MFVGIHATYAKCDATVMALRAAAHLRGLGYSVNYLPHGPASDVHPAWDSEVLAPKKLPFNDWVRRASPLLLWTEPAGEKLRLARAAGALNVLLVDWLTLADGDLPACRLFDRLLCPSWQVTTFLTERLGLKNVTFIPWDPGVPFSAAARDPAGGVRLFWSLWGSQGERQTPEAVAAVGRVLAACPHARLTVSTSAATVGRETANRVEALARRHPDRVAVLRDKNRDRHLLALARHDLLLWPSAAEPVGLCGLEALAVGVPVFAYDYPVTAEFLRDGKNSLLTPCELSYNDLGVPYVEPRGYASFADHLEAVVNDPALLGRLRQFTFLGLAPRREGFAAAWDKIIGD